MFGRRKKFGFSQGKGNTGIIKSYKIGFVCYDKFMLKYRKRIKILLKNFKNTIFKLFFVGFSSKSKKEIFF